MKTIASYNPLIFHGFFLSSMFLVAIASVNSVKAQTGTLQFEQSSYAIVEGNSGTNNLSITVTKTGSSTNAVSVQYTTVNGTATGGNVCTSGVDYISTAETLSWAAGDNSPKTFILRICGDMLPEPNDSFSVTLRNADGAIVSTPSTAFISINEDDYPQHILTFIPSPVNYEFEGNTANITVIRQGAVGAALNIDYSFINITATGGANCEMPSVDYINTAGTLTFNPGESTKTFTVQTCRDSLRESNEELQIVLSSPQNPSVFADRGKLLIIPTTPVGSDFDGDRKTDFSVFRPSNNTWHIMSSQNNLHRATQFGLATDKIVSADYDGDGKIDMAVFRDGFWYWMNSSNNSFSGFQFGRAGDIPVPADYSGDRQSNLGVYRSGIWYLYDLYTGVVRAVQFGASTDKPVPADFDKDGKTDFAVYREGSWYYLTSSDGFFRSVSFGTVSDKPLVGDYDGDGRADPAVYRNGVWYILGSTRGVYGMQFGTAADVPVPGDYDGDGKSDLAVYREGIWYLFSSQQGFTYTQFGTATDRPIPAALLP